MNDTAKEGNREKVSASRPWQWSRALFQASTVAILYVSIQLVQTIYFVAFPPDYRPVLAVRVFSFLLYGLLTVFVLRKNRIATLLLGIFVVLSGAIGIINCCLIFHRDSLTALLILIIGVYFFCGGCGMIMYSIPWKKT